MAWDTPIGVRSVRGSERNLIVCVAQSLLGFKRNSWIRVFDQMDSDTKAGMLVEVVRRLVDPALEPLALTAVNEATLGAIFAHLRQRVEDECDAGDSTHWRSLLRSTGCKEPISSTNIHEWVMAVEDVADLFLWDRDFEIEELIDAQPDVARELRRQMGIADD
jgi:hypothetical protein